MKFAQGNDWLNGGKGFTKEDLDQLVKQSETKECSMDEVLAGGDEAASKEVIASLLKRIDELEAQLVSGPKKIESADYHSITWTIATDKKTPQAGEQAVSLLVTAVENAYAKYFKSTMFGKLLAKGRYCGAVNTIELSSPTVVDGEFKGIYDNLILSNVKNRDIL
tara:strand:+ start:18582 stop:19076 length:495 start_codon:yes stop_codon:yes gene_type:complete